MPLPCKEDDHHENFMLHVRLRPLIRSCPSPKPPQDNNSQQINRIISTKNTKKNIKVEREDFCPAAPPRLLGENHPKGGDHAKTTPEVAEDTGPCQIKIAAELREAPKILAADFTRKTRSRICSEHYFSPEVSLDICRDVPSKISEL